MRSISTRAPSVALRKRAEAAAAQAALKYALKEAEMEIVEYDAPPCSFVFLCDPVRPQRLLVERLGVNV